MGLGTGLVGGFDVDDFTQRCVMAFIDLATCTIYQDPKKHLASSSRLFGACEGSVTAFFDRSGLS